MSKLLRTVYVVKVDVGEGVLGLVERMLAVDGTVTQDLSKSFILQRRLTVLNDSLQLRDANQTQVES